tara:strand:+ start:1249 stop:1392 length:144 start_codon:yes stop_codon:yes gene_type:complete
MTAENQMQQLRRSIFPNCAVSIGRKTNYDTYSHQSREEEKKEKKLWN